MIRQIAQPRSTGAPRRSPLAWEPWKPTPVPSGDYNPTLDAEQGASERGTEDETQEALTDLTRNNSDYNLGKEALERQQQEGDQAIQTSRTQEEQSTQQSLAHLAEGYKRLASTQLQQQNAAGVLGGGAALQAAAKRASNEGQEQEPIKQNESRNLAALALKQSQLDEGSQRSLGELALHSGAISPQVLRLVGELSNPGARGKAAAELAKLEETPGQAGLLGGRTSQDIVTKLVHAQRENAQFGVNVAEEKAHEAEGLGYVPPAKPGNEHETQAKAAGRFFSVKTGPAGVATPAKAAQLYHTISHGHEWWDVTPSGHVIKRRPK